MYSADFLKRYRKLLQQKTQANIASGATTLATGETPEGVKRSAGTSVPHWARSQTEDVMSIVYDIATGKAFPNPNEARKAGVVNFSYQIPSGMNVDWSYWDRFKTPEPVMPAAQPITVADQTLPFNPPAPEPYPLPSGQPQPAGSPDYGGNNDDDDDNKDKKDENPLKDPFAGISAGRLAEAKRYADAGMMGRSKQQIERGGGTWEKGGDISKALRKGAKETDRYGGDFSFQKKHKMDNVAVDTALGNFKETGKMGKAKASIEAAGGKWTKQLHRRLAAESKRKKKK